jgi:hypothetical protein
MYVKVFITTTYRNLSSSVDKARSSTEVSSASMRAAVLATVSVAIPVCASVLLVCMCLLL